MRRKCLKTKATINPLLSPPLKQSLFSGEESYYAELPFSFKPLPFYS